MAVALNLDLRGEFEDVAAADGDGDGGLPGPVVRGLVGHDNAGLPGIGYGVITLGPAGTGITGPEVPLLRIGELLGTGVDRQQ